MSERFASDLERELASGLGPVRPPESLWYRVDAELAAASERRRRPMPRVLLAFGVLVVAMISVGWYLDGPAPRAAVRPVQGNQTQHACVVCHG